MTSLESILPSARDRIAGLRELPTGDEIRIEVRLANAIGGEPVHLDNLLARLVLDALGAPALPPAPAGYDIPVPLAVLWRDQEGRPLHACTALEPREVAATTTTVIHRRPPRGEWSSKANVRRGSGRWREFRIPYRLTLAERFVAHCRGNGEAIGSLLGLASHLGKKRHHGNGEIVAVRVESAPAPFALVHDGRLTREVPVDAAELLDQRIPDAPAYYLGWTPAQWNPQLWLPGWPAGTPA